jgi:SAM-dependent methyltransferase
MNSEIQNLARSYDKNYQHSNFFGYRPWMYRAYIRALAKKAGLARESRILDLGCGQGFFTSLFADLGMKATGVDISVEAIRSATQQYGSDGARFEVADVTRLPYKNEFDCAFVRSCSLYNAEGFEVNREVSDLFLGYVKQGGVLIFDYYSRLGSRKISKTWRFHSLAAVKKHFSCYPEARVFASLRLDAILLGSLALSDPITRLAALASWSTGIGCELVAIVRKQR